MTDAPGASSNWRLPSFKTLLDLIATIVLTVAAVVVIWTQLRPDKATAADGRSREIPIPSEPLDMTSSSAVGGSTAKVGIMAFSDFQCPFCARFARDVFPELQRDYVQTGQVRFVFRHLPLDIHDAAFEAATAAECASRDGKFWVLHDRLFATDPRQLSIESVSTLAVAAGLEPRRLAECLAGDAQHRVKSDVELARRLGLGSTPVFLIGSILPDGRLKVSSAVSGARPAADFRAQLDPLLQPRSAVSTLKSFLGLNP